MRHAKSPAQQKKEHRKRRSYEAADPGAPLFSFISWYGWSWGRSGEIRALPYTGGLATPWQRHQTPFPLPLPDYLCIFLSVERGYGYQKLGWPGPQEPQPVGSRSRRFLVVCFLENPCSSPVRGSGISQESGEVVASCWGFASPWPPSPFLDYFP